MYEHVYESFSQQQEAAVRMEGMPPPFGSFMELYFLYKKNQQNSLTEIYQ